MVWEMQLHGAWLIGVSRVAPILLSAALAWWAARRLGSSVLNPLPLLSLVATSLSLRLVFEQSLFGYYFMAVAVVLVLLDVTQGRVRPSVITWLALVTLVFNPLPWGSDLVHNALPLWFWQPLLVPFAVVLAMRPLIATVREPSRPKLDAMSLVRTGLRRA